ncbi:hypothetical protein [Thioalkalivibrio paradoxus]|uniref:Uncharacterized protein n=1 Tax=Thioalkalivibrio paradoxus ARh 1 TaxID=713585 RepID=W0DFL0_9GAMM|nr:hypothetical protein [Thioalkalivibrio paradoxus]AHE97434.1 hypothetical protein THITH_03145 [Thioalkalivibrio paradoxus ARh 1]
MSSSAKDFATVEQDANLESPLRRVAYEAGMMLGLEATRDEQGYHRRRLTRQQYWLHGAGTLAGMAVSIDPDAAEDPDTDMTVRVLVGPGFGIDGLGREVLVHEPYCVNLGEWLAAQGETALHDGFDAGESRLWLRVSVRYQDCPVAAQPVLARKLNMSTDPVQPSRIADGVLLEIQPELPPAGEPGYRPWQAHGPLADAPEGLTDAEQATLAAAEAESEAAGRLMNLHARLLHALDDGVSPQTVADRLHESARLLLARIAIETTSLSHIVVNPSRISVNNLVRPFLVTPGQLAHLAR